MQNDIAHCRRSGKDRSRSPFRIERAESAAASACRELGSSTSSPCSQRSTVVMEACGSAHYWGRRIEGLGHRVVLLPPHHVKPYVRRNKTDRTMPRASWRPAARKTSGPCPSRPSRSRFSPRCTGYGQAG
jgi:transposase